MAVLELEVVESKLADEVAQALFRAHRRRVYAYCYRRLRSREEAEDAVQATFLSAWLSLEEGTMPEAPLPWLYAIAHNVCLTRHRSLMRRKQVESPEPLAEEKVAAVPRRDELHGIGDALRALPLDQRRAFMLREWRGFSYSEIAETMETSNSAVESLIFRARRGLAATLEDGVRQVRAGALCILELGAIGPLFSGAKASLLGVAGTTGAKVAASVAVVTTATTVAVAPSHPRLATLLTAPIDAAKVGVQKVIHSDEDGGRSNAPSQTLPQPGEAPVSIASEGSGSIVVHPVPFAPSTPEPVDAAVPFPPTTPGEEPLPPALPPGETQSPPPTGSPPTAPPDTVPPTEETPAPTDPPVPPVEGPASPNETSTSQPPQQEPAGETEQPAVEQTVPTPGTEEPAAEPGSAPTGGTTTTTDAGEPPPDFSTEQTGVASGGSAPQSAGS